jgi:hypothetical protein
MGFKPHAMGREELALEVGATLADGYLDAIG